MHYYRLRLILLLTLGGSVCLAQNGVPSVLRKQTADDNSKFTTVGNIGITVTNYGVTGNGFRLWPQQPSMQYPKNSGIEHMFVGGLWVGVASDGGGGGMRVTTGAIDVSSLSVGVTEGFEFTTGIDSRVLERSSLPDNPFYDPNAISHQDFIADFTDVNTTNPNEDNEPIPNHVPIGINVHMESYAFNFAFADNFVIFNFTIKNVNSFSLDSVYVGFWADLVVRNTNVTPPTVGSPFYSHGGMGYTDSLHLAYQYRLRWRRRTRGQLCRDSVPWFDAVQDPDVLHSVYQFHNTTDPTYFSPATDPDRYAKMAIGLSPIQVSLIPKPVNGITLLSVGPFSHIAGHDSLNVVFALMAAKKLTPSPTTDDSPAQKVNLYRAAQWAQKTYNGEDRNGDGIQDNGEIWTNNGQPRRYFLPAPPDAPHVKVIPKDKEVDIYWDKVSRSFHRPYFESEGL